MTIRLHSFISTAKRYVQVETQPYHITGLFTQISRAYDICAEFADTGTWCYECEEEGTVSFYQAVNSNSDYSGIWTYLVYDCPEGQEEVFRDNYIDTSTTSLDKLLAGQNLLIVPTDLKEYIQYQLTDNEYLDIQLPFAWYTEEKREIAYLMRDEVKALKKSNIFTHGVGKEYTRAIIDVFIQAAEEILEKGGSIEDFEVAQYDLLKQVKVEDVANVIVEHNDYRLWHSLLPSKSKAIEHAFNAALIYISQIN